MRIRDRGSQTEKPEEGILKNVSMPRGRTPTGLLIARLILAAVFTTAFIGGNAYIIARLLK
jgi:hypothetical protein